jgi:prohead core protein serine protease
MKLLEEIFTHEDGLFEAFERKNNKTEEKSLYLKGVFASAEKKNRNGRVYPREYLDRELQKQRLIIKEDLLPISLDHPAKPNIKLDESAGIVTELDWTKPDSNDIVGVAKIFEKTPKGSIIYSIIKEVGKKNSLGFSTRSLGSLDEEKTVQNDLNWITTDFVRIPSNFDSSLANKHAQIMYESSEYFMENGVIKEDTAKSIQNKIDLIYSNPKNRTILNEKVNNLFTDFFKSL